MAKQMPVPPPVTRATLPLSTVLLKGDAGGTTVAVADIETLSSKEKVGSQRTHTHMKMREMRDEDET